jgi:predicted peptidase
MKRWMVFWGLSFFGMLLTSPASAQGVEANLAGRSFKKTITRTVGAKYLLSLPGAYSDKEKWPLLLYLHGGMGRGDDLEKLMWYPVPKMLREGKSLPFVVIVPQCPEGGMWTDTEMLMALVDQVIADYSVDPDRVYLVGYSMGGHGAWYLAYSYPNRFAAVAPMSGMSNPWWATRLKDVPIWAFHGGKDDRVPVSETEGMVAALEKEGGNVKATIVPDRVHRPPTQEEHEALFEWLLKHRVSDRAKKSP